MTSQNPRRDDQALVRRLAEMERRIRSLETAPRAAHTSISNGKLLVRDASTGALIASLAGTSGTDLDGNPYPAGLSAEAGSMNGQIVQPGTITADAIAAGAIVAGKIAAGAIDAMTITGATIVTNSATGGFFIYAGTPAAGNMIVSIAAAGGADAFGNTYPQGLSVSQGEIDGTTINGSSISAGSLSAGSIGNTDIVNSDIQGGTMENTVITFDSNGGALLVYASTTTTATFTTSGNFTVPAGITTLAVECWGAGGGGAGGGLGGGANSGGYGGGGGAYAKLNALPVTPGAVLPYVVATGGTGGAPNNLGTNGGITSFNGTACRAYGGVAATSAHLGTGGSAASSTGDVKFSGGTGGSATGSGGSGAGSSAGPGTGGNNGANNTGSGTAAGGATVTGGGAGGAGGSANNNGTAGTAPGGGGGGGGGGASAGNGGNGARGQVRVMYTAGRSLVASISPTAGTDAFGNSYPQGIGGIVSPANQLFNTESISFTSQTLFTLNVTFSRPFTTAPVVLTNIADGSGPAAHWDSRAIAVTTTGFQLFVFAPTGAASATWASIPVQWLAIGT